MKGKEKENPKNVSDKKLDSIKSSRNDYFSDPQDRVEILSSFIFLVIMVKKLNCY